MADVADSSVALVVTSPPYFAGKEYEAALGEGHVPGSYLEYLTMLRDVFAECAPGPRARRTHRGQRRQPGPQALPVARRPTSSASSRTTSGLLLRGEIVWRRPRAPAAMRRGARSSAAANPVLRDITERIVVASQGALRPGLSARRPASSAACPIANTVTRDEFMAATLDVWEIPPESARRVGHPAPFPVELPERLIHLYTYVDDLVLDPFMGSGRPRSPQLRTGRHYVGYDTDAGYVALAEERVAAARDDLASSGD